MKKLVEGKNFDFLIMSLICMDAVILGLMTSDAMNRFFEGGLFILDRLFMAIFIIEMIMKIFAFGKKFFKSGWNVFDFAVIAISSVPFASWFIIFRTFRLFRLLRYVNKFTRLKQMINTFLALLPNFMAMLLVMAVFFYVFAIMAVCLFGDVFIEFSDGVSLFALLPGGYAGRLGVKHRASGYGGFSAFLVVLCIVCLYLVPHYRFVPDECGFGSCEEGV